MAVLFVDGFCGYPHATDLQHGEYHAGVVGSGNYILETYGKCAATVSGFVVTVAEGDLSISGRHIHETGDKLTLTAAASGKTRNDLIGMLYSKVGKVETATISVKSGAETTGTPADPTYTTGTLLFGESGAAADAELFFPMYRVVVSSSAAGTPTTLFDSITPLGGCPYDVGDYWITSSTASPAEKWANTTWERVEGRFLLGATNASSTGGNTYPVGTTGGSATVALTVAQMPNHYHVAASYHVNMSPGIGCTALSDKGDVGGIYTGAAGNNESHTNMPPWLGVFCWHRLA